MKKFLAFLGLSIAISSLQAASLDLQNATTTWTAYKTEDKTPVSGSFEKIEYKFGKNINDIAKTLEGATAMIDPMSADLKDEVKNANVRGYFFAHFAKKDSIKVKFSNVFLYLGKNTFVIMAVHMFFMNISVEYVKPYLNHNIFQMIIYKTIQQVIMWSGILLSIKCFNRWGKHLLGR